MSSSCGLSTKPITSSLARSISVVANFSRSWIMNVSRSTRNANIMKINPLVKLGNIPVQTGTIATCFEHLLSPNEKIRALEKDGVYCNNLF